MRYRDYIEIDGKKYYSGSIFIISGGSYPFYCNCDASFICYEPEKNKVYCLVNEFENYKKKSYAIQDFKKRIVSITNRQNQFVNCPTKKQVREFQIDGMIEGWVLYLVSMCVSSIFYDRIGLWSLWTFIFFNWRRKQIDKGGYYYEW